jgi:membrane protease YdiL (CAAX protease family)
LQAVGYNAWMIELAGGNAEQAQQDIVRLFNELDNPITLGLMAAVACLGAPLAEEFVFRGYIYGAVKRFAGVPVAVLFSALFFAAVHTNMAVLLPLFVLGVILAVSYEVTGSLWVPISIHFCFNSFSTGMMLLMKIPAVQKLMEEAAEHEALIRSW